MSFSNEVQVSTHHLPCSARKQYWESIVDEYVVHLDCPNQTEQPIAAELYHRQADNMRINHIMANSHAVHRNSADIQQDQRDSIFACLMTEGIGYTYQGTLSVEHSPGDLVIYDIATPYGHGFPDDMAMYVMDIPRSYFENIPLPSGQPLKISQQLTSGTSSTKVILDLLQRPTHNFQELHTRGEEILHHIHTLASAATGKQSSHYLKVLFAQCVEYIHEHLVEEHLNAERLGQQFNVTVRQVARAFEAHGISVNRYVWQQRLKKSREELICSNNQSITEIAFKWGFNHSAHFSRVYKLSFGETPSQTRKKFHHH